MLRELAHKFHKELLALPADERDIEDFALLVLKKVFEEIEQSTNAVVWNGGCDSVIFTQRNINGKPSIETIKERYLGCKDDKSDSNDTL